MHSAEHRQINEWAVAAKGGDEEAFRMLLKQFHPLIMSIVRSFYLEGAERDDLIQYARLSIWAAIQDFIPAAHYSFVPFLKPVMYRYIISAVKRYSRLKHNPLTHSTSSEVMITVGWEPESPAEPEDIVVTQQIATYFQSMLSNLLSPFELSVLELFAEQFTYKEIAEQLDCKPKQVDNAIRRIKEKVFANSECMRTAYEIYPGAKVR